jgi:hypothetical protein
LVAIPVMQIMALYIVDHVLQDMEKVITLKIAIDAQRTAIPVIIIIYARNVLQDIRLPLMVNAATATINQMHH